MWRLVLLLISSSFQNSISLTFVQQPIVTIPPNYPIGAAIFHVIVIDDIIGQKPDDVQFRIFRTEIINRPPKGKSYDSLFTIDSRIGTVLLFPHQTSTLKDFYGNTIALRIFASSESSRSNNTMLLPISILDKRSSKLLDDSCEPKQELCFAPFEFSYYLPESTKIGLVIGNVRPVAQSKLCPGIKNKYSLTSEGKRPNPVAINSTTGDLHLTHKLNYEDIHRYRFTVSCTSTYEVENSTVNAIFTKEVKLNVKNVNDNAPYLQPGTNPIIEIDVSDITPGKKIPAHFNVLDDDSLQVNNIEIELVDPLNLFYTKPPVTFEQENKTFIDIAVFAKKSFSFDGRLYNFSVIFHDKSFIHSDDNEHVTYHVTIYNETISHPVILPKGFQLVVNISQYATNLTRIAQPVKVKEKDGYSFQLFYTNTVDDQQIFEVTPKTGIIYLKDTNSLSIIINVTLELLLVWKYKESDQFECNIFINIVERDPPSASCLIVDSNGDLPPCAVHAEESICEDSCGQATAESSCQWRSSPNTTNPTRHYATCSSNLKTCPDRFCDELEAMDARICPQDCATTVIGAGYISHKGIGIGVAAEPCTCSGLTCACKAVLNNASQNRVRRKEKEILEAATREKRSNSCDAGCVAVIASVAIVATTLALVAIIVIARHVKKSQLMKHRYVANRVPLNVVISDYVDDRTVPNASNESPREVAHDKPLVDLKWEFRRDRLIIQGTLGEGEFGRVVKAQAWNIAQRPGYTTVAVKTLKENGTSAEEQDLLSELNLLREVCHPNVIQLLGACTTKGGPLYIIVEYAEYGSLRAYLRKLRQAHRIVTVDNPAYFDTDQDCPLIQTDFNIKQELLSFSWQIAKGMAYLSEIKLVHRDLAARNVLLSENKVIKISDFGLSRDVYEGDTYLKTTKGRVPVKWMAIESLEDQLYSTKSDVWSFGVVLWEIITLGATPYPGITPERLYHLLKEGYRMPQPDDCPSKLYKIMRKCWKNNPHDRPNFKQLIEKLDNLLQDTVEYLPLAMEACNPTESQYERPIVVSRVNSIDANDASTSSGAISSRFDMTQRVSTRHLVRSDDSSAESRSLLNHQGESSQEVISL